MSLTNTINNAISNFREFSHTPYGAIVIGGAANMATTLIGSLIAQKIQPQRCTFWRATLGGVINTMAMTCINSAISGRQSFDNEMLSFQIEDQQRDMQIMKQDIEDQQNEIQSQDNELRNQQREVFQRTMQVNELQDSLTRLQEIARQRGTTIEELREQVRQLIRQIDELQSQQKAA